MFFEGWGIKKGSEDQYPWPYYPIHPDNNINGITDNPKFVSVRLHEICSLNLVSKYPKDITNLEFDLKRFNEAH